MKVVINKCYGGFGLSKAAILWLRERGYQPAIDEPIVKGEQFADGEILDFDRMQAFGDDFKRDDLLVVECVESLGSEAASGELASVDVVEIPDDVQWHIHNYDGMESVHEDHRSW